jgi:hypothetical protein
MLSEIRYPVKNFLAFIIGVAIGILALVVSNLSGNSIPLIDLIAPAPLVSFIAFIFASSSQRPLPARIGWGALGTTVALITPAILLLAFYAA